MNAHPGWQPRIAGCEQQCASCPFRQGNNAEFGSIVERLRKAEGIRGKATRAIIGFARISLFMELETAGDFACHVSVYRPDMTMRDRKEWRQCAGATEVYRSGNIALGDPDVRARAAPAKAEGRA